MSVQQTIELMRGLKLHGAVQAYEDLLNNSALQDLAFNDQMANVFDGERRDRESRKLARLSRAAHPKIVGACLEDIEYGHERGLEKAKVLDFASCDWLLRSRNLIVTGPTGCGKTFLTCALGSQAARKGLPWLYKRLPDLLEEFVLAHKNGSYPRLRARIARLKLVAIDDWAIAPLTDQNRRDLLDMVDDRVGTGSLLITSQLPVSEWHDYIAEKTLADAILDRILHVAHKVELKGESQRKLRAQR